MIAGATLRLGTDTEVTSGHVAIEGNAGYLTVGERVQLPVNHEVIADRARLMSLATIGRLFANSAITLPGATVANGGPFRWSPPLALTSLLPPFPVGVPGTTNVVVPAETTLVLAPGTYGVITVGGDATLVLRGVDPGRGAAPTRSVR